MKSGPVAQRLEQGTHNPLVPGSNPGGPMIISSASQRAGWTISLFGTTMNAEMMSMRLKQTYAKKSILNSWQRRRAFLNQRVELV